MHLSLQAFSWLDIPLIFFILIVEILLSADNSAALAMIVKRLPVKKQKKALVAGLYSAFFLRALGVLFAAFLIYLFWVQLIGGAYLIFIAWQFIYGSKKQAATISPISFWKAVVYIELIDILFAIDSILGAFALASLYYPFEMIASKLWVIYLGGTLGAVAVRFATGKFITILNKHKKIETIAFLLIGWMGIKLLSEGSLAFLHTESIRHALDIFFWIGTLLIIAVGAIFLRGKRAY